MVFGGTINGGYRLVVNSAGTTEFDGVIGGGTALASLTTDAGGTTLMKGGSITTTGVQIYRDNMILGGNLALRGSALEFDGKVG